MKSESHRRSNPCSTLMPHKWQRLRLLQDVCQLNQHVLEVLSNLAKGDTGSAPAVVTENGDLWTSLDQASRHRAAQMPMLFLDMRFQDDMWWRGVAGDAPVRLAQMRTSDLYADQAMAGFTRKALMLVWPIVREDKLSTVLLFGMSESVAGVIGSMAPHELDNVSMYHAQEMRLRWAQSHGFWRKLLRAAQSADMDTLRNLHLCGLQMLGGEVMRTRSGVKTVQRDDRSHRSSNPSAH